MRDGKLPLSCISSYATKGRVWGVAMRRLVTASLALLTCASIPSGAAAVDFQPVTLDNGSTVVVVKGEFRFEDQAEALESAVRAASAKVVTFDSGGGNVDSALRLGRAIRSMGLSTIQLRSLECSSACALAFLGGVNRWAEPGSIGVHRTSFSGETVLDGHQAAAAVQALTAEIMTYMIEMGVDPRLLQLSLSTDSDDMRYLTSKEMQQYALVNATGMAMMLGSVSKPEITVTPSHAASETPHESAATEPARQTPEDRARKFVSDYHAAWSQPNGMAMAFMRNAYGPIVRFYGAEVTRTDVLREKIAFAERWPERAYSVVHGSENVACSGTCTVSGEVEWFARSLMRGKTSSGSATFRLEWDPATSQIVEETGKVITTDKGEKAPKRIISQWHDQNGACRGGAGDEDETWRACDRREVIDAKLRAIGWCYGREGEYGYQMSWHICGQ